MTTFDDLYNVGGGLISQDDFNSVSFKKQRANRQKRFSPTDMDMAVKKEEAPLSSLNANGFLPDNNIKIFGNTKTNYNNVRTVQKSFANYRKGLNMYEINYPAELAPEQKEAFGGDGGDVVRDLRGDIIEPQDI